MTSTPDTSETEVRELLWKYPEVQGQPFVLSDAGAEIGRLEFHGEPEASIGELMGQRFTFHYTTKVHPRITAHRGDSPEVLAEYVPCMTGGGVVTFDSGVRYRWRKAHVWGNSWCFCCQDLKKTVCLSLAAGPLTQGAKVSVCCGARAKPETPVLLMLAWFLRIMDFEMLLEGIYRAG